MEADVRRRLWLSALVLITTVLTAAPSSAQVTVAQTTAFFKDFDDQAMTGKGPDVNALYLPGVAIRPRRRSPTRRRNISPI